MEGILQFMRNNQVLVIIIFFSFVMRYLLMGWMSYWYDELLSVYIRGIAFDSGYEVLQYYREQGWTTPLYEFILYYWMQIFGHTEVSTRLLSTLYVLSALIFFYLFTLQIFGRRIAIATTLFFNFSFMAMYYSLEARYYSLTLFLCTLSSYLLLLYIESLKGNYSWKNIFLNTYFGLLVLTNIALMLTHLTNYIFIAAQVLFMLFYFLYRNRSENLVVNIVKVSALYTTQIIAMLIIWDFTLLELFLSRFESILILYMLGFVVVAVALIYLFICFYRQKLYCKAEWQKLTYMFLGLGFVAVFIYMLRAMIDVNIVNLLFVNPVFYFIAFIVSPNLKLSLTSFFIIIGITYFVLSNHGVRIFHESFNGVILDRKLFFIYILIWVLLPSFLMPTLISLGVGLEDFIGSGIVRARYFIFCTPPLMLILVLVLEQGIKLFDLLSRRLVGISLWRHYIKNALVYALIALMVLIIPVSYDAVTQHKHDGHDWRGISKQIVNLIRENPDSRYIIYETSPYPDPLLDYYFTRYSEDIRVYDNIQRFEEKKLASDDSYRAGFEMDEDIIKNSFNDYIIIVFAHEMAHNYSVVLERFSAMYTLHFKQIDRDNNNRGFIVYKIHGDN